MAKDDAKEPRSNRSANPGSHWQTSLRPCLALFIILTFILLQTSLSQSHFQKQNSLLMCAVQHLTPRLSASPIPKTTFITRQTALAASLQSHALAFHISTPSPHTQYYFNTSTPSLSEDPSRPTLFLLAPWFNWVTRRIEAKPLVLAPALEAHRLNTVPTRFPLDVRTYTDAQDPYDVLHAHILAWRAEVLAEAVAHHDENLGTEWLKAGPRGVLDGDMPVFVEHGLRGAGFDVDSVVPRDVVEIPQRKDNDEVEILRAVGRSTADVVRAVGRCLGDGKEAEEITEAVEGMLERLGFESTWSRVLVHRARGNEQRKLDARKLVVVQAGARYLGYASDVARTFIMPQDDTSLITRVYRLISVSGVLGRCRHALPEPSSGMTDEDYLLHVVRKAQAAAVKQLFANNTISNVDSAARDVIRETGFGDMKARVGHGVGIRAHEAPFLSEGSRDVLEPGMVVILEPSVYSRDETRARRGDVYLVKDEGEPEKLTGSTWKYSLGSTSSICGTIQQF